MNGTPGRGSDCPDKKPPRPGMQHRCERCLGVRADAVEKIREHLPDVVWPGAWVQRAVAENA